MVQTQNGRATDAKGMTVSEYAATLQRAKVAAGDKGRDTKTPSERMRVLLYKNSKRNGLTFRYPNLSKAHRDELESSVTALFSKGVPADTVKVAVQQFLVACLVEVSAK